jgi:hypothetical protein
VENALMDVGDITHVASVSKIHMLQIYRMQFWTQHCGTGRWGNIGAIGGDLLKEYVLLLL